jgi:hypothetical protein
MRKKKKKRESIREESKRVLLKINAIHHRKEITTNRNSNPE